LGAGRADPRTTQEGNVKTDLRKILIFSLTIVAVAIGASSSAAAFAFEDISGKWCGSISSYTFRPGQLIVTLYSDNSRRTYKVDSYDYADDTITVNWVRDDEKLFTKFGEFSADDRFMIQVQNTAGPRREFRRCS
jgi:hypothetical protein